MKMILFSLWIKLFERIQHKFNVFNQLNDKSLPVSSFLPLPFPLTIPCFPSLELIEFHQLVKYFKHQSQSADLFPSIQFPLKEVNDPKYFQDLFHDVSAVIKRSSNWKQHEPEIISALGIVNHVSPPAPPCSHPPTFSLDLYWELAISRQCFQRQFPPIEEFA
jgi:hypothetical protein